MQLPRPIAHARCAHRHVTNARLDRALRQVAVAHHAQASCRIALLGMPRQKLRHSASIACASNVRAPSCSTSVSASRISFAIAGFLNAKTLS